MRKEIRPKKVVISKKGDMSCVDILRKIKADREWTDLGGTMNRISRTHIMLELNKDDEKSVDTFSRQGGKGGGTSENESWENIYFGLRAQLNLSGIEESAAKRTEKACRGPQIAIITVRIGWVVCRTMQQVSFKR